MTSSEQCCLYRQICAKAKNYQPVCTGEADVSSSEVPSPESAGCFFCPGLLWPPNRSPLQNSAASTGKYVQMPKLTSQSGGMQQLCPLAKYRGLNQPDCFFCPELLWPPNRCPPQNSAASTGKYGQMTKLTSLSGGLQQLCPLAKYRGLNLPDCFFCPQLLWPPKRCPPRNSTASIGKYMQLSNGTKNCVSNSDFI
jgi:hypothetical protein